MGKKEKNIKKKKTLVIMRKKWKRARKIKGDEKKAKWLSEEAL